ncbi:hypothetical protein BAY61_01360 [Prauserella marina]|uniref:Uncharacterized protein n=2 Tax=Prauserella marina TaxID=530584 RepID=A0A222VIY9_9PSEU|nr:hypothetical protein [Prauserella marina]ASR33857.1 hypothetical protein BAY61_01360 [Prauserella marina]PWV82446.1 hypothetical protein DES30_102689 [Prauserella marina]SDC69412.1 hypothetical protein SAMN05421630_103225 [Prauserella marina]
MGTVYCGPFAEAVGYHDHEGYSARILPDGTETAIWTYETREFVGYRAHCECGWRGRHRYAATDEGEQLADEEWDRDHLRPLIDAEAQRYTVPASRLLDFTRELRESLTTTDDEQGRPMLTAHCQGVLHAAEQLERFLDDLAQNGGEL